jgi:Domain of unknown function (DUF4381)
MADVDTPPQSDPLAAGLIDIPLPAPPSLWPQTWTARITLALAAALLIVGIWRVAHWWRANRYRRAAMAELDRIEQAAGEQPAAGLAQDGAVCIPARGDRRPRRTSMARFPRSQLWRPRILCGTRALPGGRPLRAYASCACAGRRADRPRPALDQDAS